MDHEHRGDEQKDRDTGRDRKADRSARELNPEVADIEAAGVEMDPERAGRHAQHRHADGEKGQMVMGHDRKDPGLQDLQRQHIRADHEQADEKGRALCGHALYSASPRARFLLLKSWLYRQSCSADRANNRRC